MNPAAAACEGSDGRHRELEKGGDDRLEAGDLLSEAYLLSLSLRFLLFNFRSWLSCLFGLG